MCYILVYTLNIVLKISQHKKSKILSNSRGGILGGFFGRDCEILFFILVFLILFWGFGFRD
jgi:hypothetical protein